MEIERHREGERERDSEPQPPFGPSVRLAIYESQQLTFPIGFLPLNLTAWRSTTGMRYLYLSICLYIYIYICIKLILLGLFAYVRIFVIVTRRTFGRNAHEDDSALEPLADHHWGPQWQQEGPEELITKNLSAGHRGT